MKKSGNVIEVLGAYKNTGLIKTLCGKYESSSGAATLYLKESKSYLVLAGQSNSYENLEELERLLGNTKLENGSSYCINATVKKGILKSVVGAFKKP